VNKYIVRRTVVGLVFAGLIASIGSAVKYGFLDEADAIPVKKIAVKTVAEENQDPFKSPALVKYLATRTNKVTAGLYDVNTGQTYLYRPGERHVTASMVKIDILAALLYSAKRSNRLLSASESSLAKIMITQSDNNAASALWRKIGYSSGLNAFNAKLGFTQTKAVPSWGMEATTPADQLKLLKHILLPDSILSPASQKYIQSLMESVVNWQRFGIPTGVPTTAIVGVKNGWYPVSTTGWQVNTAGYVRTDDHFYLAVIMTAHNKSQLYGTYTVNKISQLLWDFQSSR
jgi:beta-lactamase class A